ncbi:early transcribed membrane protein [Plasmodium gonderi]|uniref:Early transcribed membrane protein n=1 Tax=Plasmodium gonderi TaxID=77519 RepID=A0A1Y1JK43_PLAGO|nr:early transcribed membrane protein [Plasmodium gonderi]GAW80424.1 early transcribed membrane protein [Plasmodium gonderi]
MRITKVLTTLSVLIVISLLSPCMSKNLFLEKVKEQLDAFDKNMKKKDFKKKVYISTAVLGLAILANVLLGVGYHSYKKKQNEKQKEQEKKQQYQRHFQQKFQKSYEKPLQQQPEQQQKQPSEQQLKQPSEQQLKQQPKQNYSDYKLKTDSNKNSKTVKEIMDKVSRLSEKNMAKMLKSGKSYNPRLIEIISSVESEVKKRNAKLDKHDISNISYDVLKNLYQTSERWKKNPNLIPNM